MQCAAGTHAFQHIHKQPGKGRREGLKGKKKGKNKERKKTK